MVYGLVTLWSLSTKVFFFLGQFTLRLKYSVQSCWQLAACQLGWVQRAPAKLRKFWSRIQTKSIDIFKVLENVELNHCKYTGNGIWQKWSRVRLRIKQSEGDRILLKPNDKDNSRRPKCIKELVKLVFGSPDRIWIVFSDVNHKKLARFPRFRFDSVHEFTWRSTITSKSNRFGDDLRVRC